MTQERFNIDTEQNTFEGVPVNKIPWPGVQPPGFAFMGAIYLRCALWEDYLAGDPEAKTLSVLSHEHTHTERLGKSIKPHIVYWLRRDYRFQEELAAIQEEMNVLRDHGEDFDIDKRARNLSGPAYLWCTDFDTARSELDSLWKSE